MPESKEKARRRAKLWRLENPERHKRYQRQWYRKKRKDKNFMERARENSFLWRKNNPHSARTRYRNNPTKSKIAVHKRRVRILGNGGSFTEVQWKALCNKYHNICLCCRRRRRLTIDHVIPITKGGTNCITNIQPLCKSCNSSKNNKIADYRHILTRNQWHK